MDEQQPKEDSGESTVMTKAERKQQRREEKRRAREQEASRKRVKRAGVWAAVAVGLAVIVGITFNLGTGSEKVVDGPVEGGQVKEGDWVAGKVDAAVVLVEYADFQCPACANYSQIVNKLKENFGDRVAFVYRHFPLKQIHKNGVAAAMAAEAAGRQGKFWEMHDLLYERQDEWSDSGEADKMFAEYAGMLSLDVPRWQVDSAADDLKEKINRSYQEAVGLGLNSTPSFILNGKMIEARSYEQFEQLIKQELGE